MRTNLIRNPSFEVNVSDNTALENSLSGGTAVLSRDAAVAQSGSSSAKIIITSPANSDEWRVKLRMNDTNLLSLTNGLTYTAQVRVKTSDARNVKIGLENGTHAATYDSAKATSSSEFTLLTFTFTATSTGTAKLNLLVNTGSTGTIWIDSAFVELSSYVNDYFDGSLTDTLTWDYAWTGTAHNSTSTATIIGVILYANGLEKTPFIDWRSIGKDEMLTKEPDTLRFLVKNFGTKVYRPALGDEILLYNNESKVFGGYIVETNETVEGLAKYFDVVCKDYTQILDRKLVSKTYSGQTASAIIADLISTFTTGFTTTNVVAAVTVQKITFNYLPVSKCLQKLASMLGNYDWYVDYDKDIHFFNNALMDAPFDITDTSQNYVWGSLEIESTTHQIRNKIIVRGGEIESATSRTEYFNGDGTKLIFPLGSKFSLLPTVTVGGVAKTVGVDFIDAEASYDCFWNFNEKYLRFKISTVPAAGTNNVAASGLPLFPLILQKSSNSSILAYGEYQYVIVDKTIRDVDAASQRADAELLMYANPSKTGSFRTSTSGLKAGQTINVSSSLRSLSQDYKIQSIKTKLRTPDSLEFQVMLVTADDVGINDILNKLLVTDPSDQIEIDSNEQVQRYESFAEAVAIIDTLNAPTKDSPPYTWGAASSNPFRLGFGTWHS